METNNNIATQKEVSEDEIFRKIRESQKSIFDEPKETVSSEAGATGNEGQAKAGGNSGEPGFTNEPSNAALPGEGFTGEVIKEELKPQGLLGLMNPDTAIAIFDIVMSRVSVIGSRFAGVDAKNSDFKLDAQEKATLKPLLSASLERLNFQSTNPHVNLLIAVVILYALKIVDLADRQSNERKLKPQHRKDTIDRLNSLQNNNTEIKKGRGRPRKYPIAA